ncbi:MAG: hypothetical protein JST59_27015 [Actinobacteria bacterium]|nr:hypothetical protein [Actinomycetota bacterium]
MQTKQVENNLGLPQTQSEVEGSMLPGIAAQSPGNLSQQKFAADEVGTADEAPHRRRPSLVFDELDGGGRI